MSHTPKRRARKSRYRAYPNLAMWRASRNLNQREAAEILDLTQSTYSRFERGVGVPVRETAKRIMAETGVPLEVLVGVA